MSKDLQDSLKKYPSSTKPFNPPLSERFCRLEKLARAPGLQGKEDEGISRRGGSCYLGWWTWAFLFFPEYSTFCFSFTFMKSRCVSTCFSMHGVGSPRFIVSWCKKGAAHSYSPFCSARRGSCTQWFLCLAVYTGRFRSSKSS